VIVTPRLHVKAAVSPEHHSRPRDIRLSREHERWVYGVGTVLLISGLLWLMFHYFITVHGPFGEEAHPLTSWWLRLHGAAAMAFLIVFGTLFPVHVRRAWQVRANRYTGLALFALVTVLVVSGYGLYYASSEELRPWISVIHWGIGLLGLPMLAIHIVAGKRRSTVNG
jgi:cation transport ATPase